MTRREVEKRALIGAQARNLDDQAIARAGANAGYWYFRGVPSHRAVAWGLRDAEAEQRRRDIETQIKLEATA